MRTLILFALVLWGALTTPAAFAAERNAVNDNGITCFNGYAYTLKGGQYRYTEHHEQTRVNGRITTWNVTYVGSKGRVIATKHMDFSANPTVPTYILKMPASGYVEGIRHQDTTWTMFRRESAHASLQTKEFAIDPPMAADSGFNALVQTHFQALENGRSIAFKFVAAGRQSVINLKAFKIGTTTFEGRNAVVFKAELDMFLVHLFVSSLKLTYDPHTERLLEYRGIGNMHNTKGKVYPVRVSYYTHMPEVARKHGAPAAHCGSVDNNG